MKLYDISLTISPNLPVWPGDPAIELERIQKMEAGDSANVTRLAMSAHAGTHVDAPYHFLGGNTPTVELLPLEWLTGPAQVVHLPETIDLVTGEVLRSAGISQRTRRLLIRTRNSSHWQNQESKFYHDFVAISPDGAAFLVERGIHLIGVDYLSVAPYKEGTATHEILLKAGMVILEGLNLSGIAAGRYRLYCLPLKLAGADGAPARAILISR